MNHECIRFEPTGCIIKFCDVKTFSPFKLDKDIYIKTDSATAIRISRQTLRAHMGTVPDTQVEELTINTEPFVALEFCESLEEEEVILTSSIFTALRRLDRVTASSILSGAAGKLLNFWLVDDNEYVRTDMTKRFCKLFAKLVTRHVRVGK